MGKFGKTIGEVGIKWRARAQKRQSLKRVMVEDNKES